MVIVFGWYLFIAAIWAFVCWARKTSRDASPIERRVHASLLGLVWPWTFAVWLYNRFAGGAVGHGAATFQAAGPLPATSYGYQPPADATAHGWRCTSDDCGMAEHEWVRRWPHPCPRCGAPTDPLLDHPWSHDAEGVELQRTLQRDAQAGGGFYKDQWVVWQLKDGLLKRDAGRTASARAQLQSYAAERAKQGWWGPGNVYFTAVWAELEAGQVNDAAEDLVQWVDLSKADDVENDNTNRTNCRQVIDMASKFLADPSGRAHPLAPRIRQGCLKLAEGCYQVLDREQQGAVSAMARA